MPRTRKPGSQRRAEILDTARELFLGQGYSRVVMDDIAHACGIARTTLYEYYPNKEQMLVGMIDQVLDEAYAIVPTGKTCRDRLTDVAAKRLERLLSHRSTYQLIFRELPSLSGPIGERFVAERLREWQEVLAEAQAAIAAGEIRSDVAPADVAFAFNALVAQRGGELLMMPGDDTQPAAEAVRLVRLLWSGVGTGGSAS